MASRSPGQPWSVVQHQVGKPPGRRDRRSGGRAASRAYKRGCARTRLGNQTVQPGFPNPSKCIHDFSHLRWRFCWEARGKHQISHNPWRRSSKELAGAFVTAGPMDLSQAFGELTLLTRQSVRNPAGSMELNRVAPQPSSTARLLVASQAKHRKAMACYAPRIYGRVSVFWRGL